MVVKCLPECDRQTHRQIHDDGIDRASIASRGKMVLELEWSV